MSEAPTKTVPVVVCGVQALHVLHSQVVCTSPGPDALTDSYSSARPGTVDGDCMADGESDG